MINTRKILVYLITFCAIALLRLLAHELGHLLSVIIIGGKINLIAIMPGIRLYPTLGLQTWGGWGAIIDYSLNNGTPSQAGFIAFIGSGATAILGYGAIAVLLARKPHGLAQFAWLTAALLFVWDIIAYSIFPELGLRHWILIGQRVPEPLIGALYMGVPFKTYQIGLTLHSLISNGSILYYLFRIRNMRNF
jgi:hypothetical protein